MLNANFNIMVDFLNELAGIAQFFSFRRTNGVQERVLVY